MTKLTYKIVNNNEVVAENVATYAEAVQIKQANLGSRLVSCYEPLPEKTSVFLSPKKKMMRVKAN